MNLITEWSGRGADSGKDLFFTEVQKGSVSESKVKWVVSCKDKAQSGHSVLEKDLPPTGIKDKLTQHEADGFLLVTTTTVSTAAKDLIDGLDVRYGGKIHTQVWDAPELIRILLKEQNHDLIKQFLPQSYARVKGITTLEGAIYANKDLLPDEIFSEVLQLVKPYSNHELKGSKIWSFDLEVAQSIDAIVKSLLIEENLDQAILLTEDMDYGAYLAFVKELHKAYPAECLKYLWETVTQYAMSGLSYNAFCFLADNYKLTREEILILAQFLDDEFTLIDNPKISQNVNSEVIQTVKENLSIKQKNNELIKKLTERVDNPITKILENHSITYYVEYTNQVNFMGKTEIEISGDNLVKSNLFLIEFDGYFDKDKVHLKSISLRK